MRRRARDAPAAEVADDIEQSFRIKLFLLLLDIDEEVAVVEECCFRL